MFGDPACSAEQASEIISVPRICDTDVEINQLGRLIRDYHVTEIDLQGLFGQIRWQSVNVVSFVKERLEIHLVVEKRCNNAGETVEQHTGNDKAASPPPVLSEQRREPTPAKRSPRKPDWGFLYLNTIRHQNRSISHFISFKFATEK
jgi:hypothetical protein